MAFPPSNKANQLGSGFTTLQRYLGANKSNKLGSTVGTGIQQAGQAAVGDMQQAGQKFQQGFQQEQNRLGAEGQRVDRVMGDVTKASDEDVNAFEGIRSGVTKGPQQIENANELREKARQAKSLGEATGSQEGRYGLLQRYVGAGKQYTGGQQRLDNLLLGQTGAGNLRQARRDTSGLVNQQQVQENTALNQGRQLAGQAQGLAANTISRLGTGVTDYDKAMQDQIAKSLAERTAYVDQARKDLAETGQVDEDLFKKFGVEEGKRIWDADLGQFVKESDYQATKQNVQKQSDYNKIDALRRLSGNSLTGDPSAALAAYADKNQVGLFDKQSKYANIQEGAPASVIDPHVAGRISATTKMGGDVVLAMNRLKSLAAGYDIAQGESYDARSGVVRGLESGSLADSEAAWDKYMDRSGEGMKKIVAEQKSKGGSAAALMDKVRGTGDQAERMKYLQEAEALGYKAPEEGYGTENAGEFSRKMQFLQQLADAGKYADEQAAKGQAGRGWVDANYKALQDSKRAWKFDRTFKKKPAVV